MPGSSGRHLSLAQTPWRACGVPLPELPPGTVHLWRAALRQPPKVIAQHYELLSVEEKERAAKFYFPEDRDHFINARGILRYLLSRYLQVPAAAVSFQYSTYGKPSLTAETPLHFNVSHAGGYGLFGFTSGGSLGVDLEKTDESIEVKRLVSRFFSPDEAAEVLALPPDARPAAFFRTWTRKEAFIKAHGEGLALPLDQFAVTVPLDEPVEVRQIDWAPNQAGAWSLTSFMVQEELPGAMVVRGKLEELRFFNW